MESSNQNTGPIRRAPPVMHPGSSGAGGVASAHGRRVMKTIPRRAGYRTGDRGPPCRPRSLESWGLDQRDGQGAASDNGPGLHPAGRLPPPRPRLPRESRASEPRWRGFRRFHYVTRIATAGDRPALSTGSPACWGSRNTPHPHGVSGDGHHGDPTGGPGLKLLRPPTDRWSQALPKVAPPDPPAYARDKVGDRWI